NRHAPGIDTARRGPVTLRPDPGAPWIDANRGRRPGSTLLDRLHAIRSVGEAPQRTHRIAWQQATLPEPQRADQRLSGPRTGQLDGAQLVELHVEIEQLVEVLERRSVDRGQCVAVLEAELGGDRALGPEEPHALDLAALEDRDEARSAGPSARADQLAH